MQTKEMAEPTPWRDLLSWEVSPFVGGASHFALSHALGLDEVSTGGFGFDLFVAIVIFAAFALPLMLVSYFALSALRFHALWIYPVVGLVLGSGLFSVSGSIPEIAVNGASGALCGAFFGVMRGSRKKAAEPGATDNPDDAQRIREDH